MNYNFAFIYGICNDLFKPVQQEQKCEGNIIPEKLKLDLFKDSGFFIGMKNGLTGYIGKPATEDGHILCVGYPSSGKTQGLVIPTMKTWKGSQINIDIKRNLLKYWKKLNKHTGKKLKVFSPGAPKGSNCWYDPFAPLRRGNVVGNARILALALIPLLPSNRDPIWVTASQNFLTGAIIYYFEIGFSFIETMEFIQLTPITELVNQIMGDNNMTARIYMSKLKDVQEKVIGNLGMEISNLATLVTDPEIKKALLPKKGCDLLDWQELNTTTEPVDIILEFPEDNLERWEPMILLLINQLIKSLEQRPERTYDMSSELPPVLVMLDEFPRLGKIFAIENGLATLRSRGVTFALFVQSFAQLEKTYGSIEAKVIADLCAYKAILGIGDPASQEYFSKAIGCVESTHAGISANIDPISKMISSWGINSSETRKPIIYPQDFLTLQDVVLLNPFSGFCRADKTLYHEHEELFLDPQSLQNQEEEEGVKYD